MEIYEVIFDILYNILRTGYDMYQLFIYYVVLKYRISPSKKIIQFVFSKTYFKHSTWIFMLKYSIRNV